MIADRELLARLVDAMRAIAPPCTREPVGWRCAIAGQRRMRRAARMRRRARRARVERWLDALGVADVAIAQRLDGVRDAHEIVDLDRALTGLRSVRRLRERCAAQIARLALAAASVPPRERELAWSWAID